MSTPSRHMDTPMLAMVRLVRRRLRQQFLTISGRYRNIRVLSILSYEGHGRQLYVRGAGSGARSAGGRRSACGRGGGGGWRNSRARAEFVRGIERSYGPRRNAGAAPGGRGDGQLPVGAGCRIRYAGALPDVRGRASSGARETPGLRRPRPALWRRPQQISYSGFGAAESSYGDRGGP